MRTSRHTGMLVALFLTLLDMPGVFAQENVPQLDGWQGPRPLPHQRTLTPAPQPPVPSRPQVLEVPPHSQPSTPELLQQRAVPSSPPQRQSTRPTQLLSVTVTDPSGRYVPGLRAEDFVVYEEDMPQPITYFNTGQNEPVSLGLLVDMSESMLSKLGRARQALIGFVKAIKPYDEVFLEAFNQQPQMLQDFTDSRQLLAQATALLQPMGRTALYDAILDGLRRVKQGRHQKRALVVISDGMDTASRASLTQTLTAIRNSGILVYTIGIGNLDRGSRGMGLGPRMGLVMGGGGRAAEEAVDVRLLQALSDETGAKHFLLNTADVLGSGAVLDSATQTIAQELRQQYSVGYHSPLKGDLYRNVRVETRREKLVVRTQKGAS